MTNRNINTTESQQEIWQASEALRTHLEFIQLGIAALNGIGALLQPETEEQQLNLARSSDASAVFRFIGEALEGPANEAYNAKERLESALKAETAIPLRGGHHG